MTKRISPFQLMRRLLRDNGGAALVEFAIVLPLLLLIFGVIIEGGRLMWSYQTAASGVRDATRYLARVTPSNICTSGGGVAGQTSKLESIVRESINGTSVFRSGVTVTSVTPALSCVTGVYRVSPAPVARVTASLQVTFPLGSLFSFFGSSLNTINTNITDESRVFGS